MHGSRSRNGARREVKRVGLDPPRARAVTRTSALAAGICIIIAQSLTLQRSLRSMSGLDYVSLAIIGIAIPFLVSAWFVKKPASRFSKDARGWLLAFGAVFQGLFVVIWPAYSMPGTLAVVIGGNLVYFSGATIQFSILCTGFLLAVHSTIMPVQDAPSRGNARPVAFFAGTGSGVLLAGAGLGLAAHAGWTMYVIPSLLVMLGAGISELVLEFKGCYRPRDVEDLGTERHGLEARSIEAPQRTRPGNVLMWSTSLFMILPFLLLAMNFQRQRYAAGYYPVLLILGAASFLALASWWILHRARGTSPQWLMFLGSLAAGCFNAIPLGFIAIAPPDVVEPFFKSTWYTLVCIGAFAAGMVGLIPSIINHSYILERDVQDGKKLSNVLLGGVTLALIVIVFLFEGTSMVYSWTFDKPEPLVVVSAANAAGWFLFAVACGLARSKKHERK